MRYEIQDMARAVSCIFSFNGKIFYEIGCQPVSVCDIMDEALPVILMTAVYECLCMLGGRQKGEYMNAKSME